MGSGEERRGDVPTVSPPSWWQRVWQPFWALPLAIVVGAIVLGLVVRLPPVTWAAAGYGALTVVVGLVLALVLGRLVRTLLRRRGRGASSSVVFGRLAAWRIAVLAVLAGLTVTFPSIEPVNILGGVGVISIAAGIAFQTVLGNMFAGIVILARDEYRVGDQIAVDEHRGTVTKLGLTSTSIRSFDGRLLLVPNGVLHSSTVTVQTGFEYVRSTVALDLDLAVALREAEQALTDLPQVLAEPDPQVLLAGVVDGAVRVEARFWSGSTQLETREAQHAVTRAVLEAYHRQGVRLAAPPVIPGSGSSAAGS